MAATRDVTSRGFLRAEPEGRATNCYPASSGPCGLTFCRPVGSSGLRKLESARLRNPNGFAPTSSIMQTRDAVFETPSEGTAAARANKGREGLDVP